MRTGRFLLLLCAFAGAALEAGCAHYQWGTRGRLPFTSLYVEPVRNRTLLPQAEAPIETQLRLALIQDGRVQIVDSPAAADAVLAVVISGFKREVAAVRQQDTGLASKFAETLTAQCTLIDRRSGRAYFENRVVQAKRDVFTDSGNPHSPLIGDQLQSEYNTIPLLAESLSNHIAHAVLDVW
ncbi:MAG: LPS assembly lipoprotein LptE [Opitutaceae bacterium]